jgi:hypothetical protein
MNTLMDGILPGYAGIEFQLPAGVPRRAARAGREAAGRRAVGRDLRR